MEHDVHSGRQQPSPGKHDTEAVHRHGARFCAAADHAPHIEEQLLYPQLAVRMDDFRNQDGKKGGSKPSRKQSELLLQHRLIHEGMDRFEDYLTECRRGQLDFEMATLKTKMDDWNDVLWLHLDAEVETLKAENMRKYWTLPEMRRLQI
ncbi:hypothetical protein MCOR02_009572 [Pyricularia oryzae]|nr:hypothetical protein MCOR02_009572 [Pyricularia oryzae]